MENEPTMPLPWMDPGNFPAPLESEPCGYLGRKKLIACAPDALKEAIRKDKGKVISLVWTEAGGPMAPPLEVPWLRDVVIERERAYAGQHATMNLFNIGIWGLLAFANSSNSRSHAWEIYLFSCLLFGVIPLVENRLALRRFRSMTPGALEQQVVNERYLFWLSTRGTPWTQCLGACIAIVAIGQIVCNRSSFEAAAIVKPAIHAGEWWRLLTGTLMHGSVLHFLFNILALLGLGRILETTFHRAYVPVVFAASALAGSVASLFLMPRTTSVGASGGIMGLVGFLIVLAWVHKRDFPQRMRRALLMSAVYTAAAGAFAFRLIDNAAHAGGFIAGALLAWLMVRTHAVTIPDKKPPLWIVAGIVSWGVIFATTGLCMYEFFR